jgi:hypothetical protein
MRVKTLSDYWQYIAWSIWGGIGFISVPSSCSILYLFQEMIVRTKWEIKKVNKLAVGKSSYKLNRSS